MAFPKPVAGLVIRYGYLWHDEYIAGRDEGVKDRPCAIIAAVSVGENQQTRVLVLPITHTPPERMELAVEIPAKVKQRLGLDDDRSWIVLSEWNDFVWPGPDLRSIAGARGRRTAYGPLPPSLFQVVRDRFVSLVTARASKPVHRT